MNFYKKSLAYFTLLILCAGIYLPHRVNATEPIISSSVVMSEVAAFESSDNEWIEITNIGTSTVDLVGWKFYENETNHGLTLLRGRMELGAGEYAVIANKADAFASLHPEYTGVLIDSSWTSLSLDGETLGLKNSSGELIELLSYPQHEESSSLERTNLQALEEWAQNPTPSIGTEYVATAPEQSPPVTSDVATESVDDELQTVTPNPTTAPPPISAIRPNSNLAPRASFTFKQATALTVIFDGHDSSDPNGDALTFLWDFGDGTTTTSPTPGTHLYTDFGSYVVRLIVRDSSNSIGMAERTITLKEPVTKPIKKSPDEDTSAAMRLDGEIETLISNITPSDVSPISTNGDLSTEIFISELMPSPQKGDEEWIELHNEGATAVNLGGWLLADLGKRKKPYKFPGSITIESDGYLLLPTSQTHISLNNDEDMVILGNYEGEVMDSVHYSGAQKGASYMRGSNSEWTWTATSTPGEANPHTQEFVGTVSSLDDQNRRVRITAADGKEEVLSFGEDVIETVKARALLREGTQINGEAFHSANGLALAKINSLVAPALPAEQKFRSIQDSAPWSSGFIVLVTLMANLPAGYLLYEKLKERRELQKKKYSNEAVDVLEGL